MNRVQLTATRVYFRRVVPFSVYIHVHVHVLSTGIVYYVIISSTYSDSLTPEERTSLEAEITNLRKSEARLRVEVSQLKEVSDVARQQVVAMETWKKSHDLVMSSLHHQLLDAQTGSDDKAMVGKLQQQITTLQVSESEATRKLEAASVKVYMRIAENHNSLGCEQPPGLDVNQSLIAQDAFLPHQLHWSDRECGHYVSFACNTDGWH